MGAKVRELIERLKEGIKELLQPPLVPVPVAPPRRR
jgi:hypothetical protein